MGIFNRQSDRARFEFDESFEQGENPPSRPSSSNDARRQKDASPNRHTPKHPQLIGTASQQLGPKREELGRERGHGASTSEHNVRNICASPLVNQHWVRQPRDPNMPHGRGHLTRIALCELLCSQNSCAFQAHATHTRQESRCIRPKSRPP